jgi:hypothetical protein
MSVFPELGKKDLRLIIAILYPKLPLDWDRGHLWSYSEIF